MKISSEAPSAPSRYDVIIAGGGLSGLYAALNLNKGLRALMLTKREPTLSNSSLAQGGIACVYDKEHDSLQKHINDTLVAGGFRNKAAAVEILASEGPADVRRLMDLGVEFDKGENGEIHLTLEGGHTRPRILHYKDCTGREIVNRLLEQVHALNNVTLMPNTMLCGLQKKGSSFFLDTINEDNSRSVYSARFLMLCTGGIGRVYEYTTNSSIATGDGITLAHAIGARVKNLHYIQFHPTAFANKHTRESFLISESVRGEGAYLLNCKGERFMQSYDERLELAPRDVVSRSIIEEAKRTGSKEFFLDITHKDVEFVKARFPMIYENLKKEGYDMTKERIPVFPCQHYLMGGIDVNLNSKTTIDGLYACGECSHTGVHGANRLASNSLLEAVVFSRRAAQEINRLSDENRYSGAADSQGEYTESIFAHKENGESIPHGIRTEVRSLMQSAYFVIPDKAAAKTALSRITEIRTQLIRGNYILDKAFAEARSLTELAYLILNEITEQ